MTGTISSLCLALALTTIIFPALANGNKFGQVYNAFRNGITGGGQQDTNVVAKLSKVLSEEIHPRYELALQVLDSFETIPSCRRHAWSDLIISCSDLDNLRGDDGTGRRAELVSDDIRSIFATRLAICELENVGAVPLPCADILSPATDRSSGYSRHPPQQSHPGFTFNLHLVQQHKACLEDIFKSPQTWTSYSNSLQHAYTICEASQQYINKDEALRFYQSMLNVAEQTAEANSDNLNHIHQLSLDIIKLAQYLSETMKKQQAHATQTGKMLKDALDPVLMQIFEAGAGLDANLKYIQLLADKMLANDKDRADAHGVVMAKHAANEDAINAYSLAMAQFLTGIETKYGVISHMTAQLGASVEQIFPKVAQGLAELDETTTGMMHSNLALGKEMSDAIVEAGVHLKNVVEEQEMLYNRTLLAAFSRGVITIDTVGAVVRFVARTTVSTLHSLPAPVIAVAYFAIFMTMMGAANRITRKLGAIPATVLFKPFRALAIGIAATPWPITLVVTILSMYFGVIEHPGELADRWAQLHFDYSDTFLSIGVFAPLFAWAVKCLREEAPTETAGLPTSEKTLVEMLD